MDWGKVIASAEKVLTGIEKAVEIAQPILAVALPGSSAVSSITKLVEAGLQFTQNVIDDATAAGEIAAATDIDALKAVVARYEALNEALGAQIAAGD